MEETRAGHATLSSEVGSTMIESETRITLCSKAGTTLCSGAGTTRGSGVEAGISFGLREETMDGRGK